MALRGDLASVDLAQVFQMLALNKKVGLLSIQSAKLWKVLYFDQRGVTVYHNEHALSERVLAASVRAGQLAGEAASEVREHAAQTGQPLAHSLLAGGYLDESELAYRGRTELEEEIYDLFFCREARFEFHEGATYLEAREGVVDPRFFFNCDSVIMEAARRIDEWAYITERIPSTAQILVSVADLEDDGSYGVDAGAIFDLLDGRRSVARIVELTGLTAFQVCKTLGMFLDARLIAPVAADDLLKFGNQCLDEGRLPDAINLYERAIEAGIGLPESHGLAARAYQAAEQYEQATFHLESEAEHRVTEHDFEGAARCLVEARNLVPTNLAARERLVELCVAAEGVHMPGFDPLEEGKELVELLGELGDMGRVRAVLERLLTFAPHDPDLKKALVNVHIRAGDQKRVIQLYEAIAEDLVALNKPIEAISYLQKILLLDRSRSDVSERVRRLYEVDERARKRARLLGALAALFLVLAAVGAGYYYYDEQARERFAEIDVTGLVAGEDFATARQQYEEFILQHPLTTSVPAAEAELQKIASAQQMFEARLASTRAEREARVLRIRKDYAAAWERHRKEFLSGRTEQSFATLEQVRALVAEAGQVADVEWALQQKLQLTYENLRDYLNKASELGAAYDQSIAAADYGRAREVALELHEGFETTAEARRVRVPVMVTTRPAGALLMYDGEPLTRLVRGREEPLRTPGLVLCGPGGPVRLTARREGFVDLSIAVDGRESGQLDLVMEVVPERVLAFDAPAQTGVGLGGGWLALGLRGGLVGFARTDGTKQQVVDLGGLKSAEGTPAIANGRIFFLSNEASIECLPVEPSVARGRWPVRLQAPALTPLCLGDGRVALVDNDHVLRVWEQASGRELWSAQLPSAPSGRPAIARRKAYVGTRDGSVVVFDVSDGRQLNVLRSPAGITTRVHVHGDMLFFGCDDGAVRAVDFAAGEVSWVKTVGDSCTDAGFVTTSDHVVVASSGRLVLLDRASGVQVGAAELDAPVVQLQAQDKRAFVFLRREGRSGEESPRDVLAAVDIPSAEVLWEYALDAVGPGDVGVDGVTVAVPTPRGEVVLLR